MQTAGEMSTSKDTATNLTLRLTVSNTKTGLQTMHFGKRTAEHW